MRKIVFLLLIFNFQFSILHCQEYIWPIKKDNNSEKIISVKNKELDILYRPQEYIEKEYNFGDLFLTAPEGTPVVAPVDGTIISYYYTYHSSILTSCNPGIEVTNDFNIDRRNISELVKSGRTCIKKFDEKYLSLSVGIQTADGRKVWISGLHPAKRYKTGEKIKKGEIIGTMGYSYKPIGQPSIKIEVSEKDGRWSDPMAPFGLKSTFIKYADKKIPAVLSKAEAKEDYEILIGALKEGHPGLYDYMSEQEFENHVNHTINTISAKISIADFERLVIATVNKIRDSHTAVISPPNFKNRIAQYYPSVYFGWLNNSLIVNRVADSEKQYYGKRIVAVDSIPVDSLKEMIRPYFEKQEGFIENFGDLNFLNTALKYFEYVPSASKKCDVTLQFEDGTQKFFKGYKSHGQKSGLIPDREDLLKFLMINQPADEEVIVKMLSDSVAYVGISTFSMNDVEFDQLREFMKSISNSGCPNLIIDVRNNSGGKDDTKFFSYIAQEPFKAFEYTKVNKQENYEYLQYSLNYTPEIVSYSYFVPVEGKSGFYSFNDELCYPDRSINYIGKVYILTNERSYSASSDLAALIKKYYRGAVVGRETGSGFYQMNARETPQLRLPNSLIVVRYPLVKFVFISQPDERIPWGRGVLPDYPVSFTLEDFAFANGDTVLNYALHLIETGKYIEKPLTPENSVPNKTHWGIYLCIGLVMALVAVLFGVFHRKKRREL
jgi:hypothetical protein